MKKREMIITIGPDGGVNIEVQGVPGADCVDFSKFLEDELGTVTSRERTPEFYQEADSTKDRIRVGSDE